MAASSTPPPPECRLENCLDRPVFYLLKMQAWCEQGAENAFKTKKASELIRGFSRIFNFELAIVYFNSLQPFTQCFNSRTFDTRSMQQPDFFETRQVSNLIQIAIAMMFIEQDTCHPTELVFHEPGTDIFESSKSIWVIRT